MMCWETKLGVAKLLCSHEACIECLKGYVEANFVDGNFATFKCFAPGC